MLEEKLLKEIENKVIISRRQLYKKIGRSKKLLIWLNDNKILIPKKWDKGRVKSSLLSLSKGLKRLPIASDNEQLTGRAQKYYGTWNNALRDVFGITNQRFHNHLKNDELLNLIIKHIKIYKTLPLRMQFDGKSKDYPYWEVYVYRFNLKKWSQIFSLIDLTNIKYYNNTKHGTGKIHILDGIVYLSHQEYLIGKYLTKNKINFEKEVPYKNCNYIFDFYLSDYNIYIEYYGLATKEYKDRIIKKRKYYNGRNVLEIFKHDNTIKKLDSKVQRL